MLMYLILVLNIQKLQSYINILGFIHNELIDSLAQV